MNYLLSEGIQFLNLNTRFRRLFRNKSDQAFLAMKLKNIKNEQIEAACREFDVEKLYVFGSVAAGSATEESDVDFLVEFKRSQFEGAFDQFMGLKTRLEEIVGTPVDLLTLKKFRNPVFNEEIEKSKSLIYAA